MSETVEGLVETIRSLPRGEKSKLLEALLRDPETMEAMGNVIIDRLFGARRKNEPLMRNVLRPEEQAGAGMTSQEKARRVRARYITDLGKKGIRLEQAGNTWARAASGLWVALPLATEQRKNHFLLGISEESFRKKTAAGRVAFVLLCEPAEGGLLDFVIPPDMVRKLSAGFSRSHGQLKLNLKRVGDNYYLVVPGQAAVNVTALQGKTGALK
jgi:hypothetical protein